MRVGCHSRGLAIALILAAHGIFEPDGADIAQYLGFLVAHRVGIQRSGRFHGHQRKQLQQVVLEHVAHHAGLIVIATASAYIHILGHGDLDVGNVAPVPHRLEQRVGKTQEQDVLRGFFAEIVINAVHLMFPERLVHPVVQRDGGSEIMPEGFFDDDPPPAFGFGRHVGGGQIVAGGAIELRRGGQIIEAVGGLAFNLAQPPIHLVVIFRHFQVAPHVADARRKLGPRLFIEGAAIAAHALAQVFAEKIIAPVATRHANDPCAVPQAPFFTVVEQRGDQLALGQVAGGAKNDDGGGFRLGNLITHDGTRWLVVPLLAHQ